MKKNFLSIVLLLLSYQVASQPDQNNSPCTACSLLFSLLLVNTHNNAENSQTIEMDNIDNFQKTPCSICTDIKGQINFHYRDKTNKSDLIQCEATLCNLCLSMLFECPSCRAQIEK